jgi:hypothetical protein
VESLIRLKGFSFTHVFLWNTRAKFLEYRLDKKKQNHLRTNQASLEVNALRFHDKQLCYRLNQLPCQGPLYSQSIKSAPRVSLVVVLRVILFPSCIVAHYSGTQECWKDYSPRTGTNGVHLLSSHTEARVEDTGLYDSRSPGAGQAGSSCAVLEQPLPCTQRSERT